MGCIVACPAPLHISKSPSLIADCKDLCNMQRTFIIDDRAQMARFDGRPGNLRNGKCLPSVCVCVGGLAHSATPLSHPPQAKCPTCYLLDFHLALLCSSDNFNFYRQGKAWLMNEYPSQVTEMLFNLRLQSADEWVLNNKQGREKCWQ